MGKVEKSRKSRKKGKVGKVGKRKVGNIGKGKKKLQILPKELQIDPNRSK